MINIKNRRELFVDRYMIDSMDGTFLKLHEPVPAEKSIVIDRPNEGGANAGSVVIKTGGRYLMYYRGMKADAETGVSLAAESEDGVNWIKRENNLVSPGGVVWLDTRPGIPENERIKSFRTMSKSGIAHTPVNDPPGGKYLLMYTSADGYNFTKMDPQPVIESDLLNSFDGGNNLFWSEAEQKYLLYYRILENDNGFYRRSVARMTSEDFYTWSEPVVMKYSDTPEQFYTNNTEPYFRAPHIYIAPAARFMERRRVVTDQQIAEIGLMAGYKGDNTYFNDCSDAVLLTSRAGSDVYDRTFMETFIRPGIGYGNWVSRTNYPLTGIFPLDESRMMMYVSRHYMQNSWHVERLLLRTDGFASLSAPWKGGELTTKQFIFEGGELELNYRTSAAGFVRVEIICGDDVYKSEEIIGDEIKRAVKWQDDMSIANVSGKPVYMRFVMKDADVFSYKFN